MEVSSLNFEVVLAGDAGWCAVWCAGKVRGGEVIADARWWRGGVAGLVHREGTKG